MLNLNEINKTHTLSKDELIEIEGGFAITLTTVGVGDGIFSGAFGVGYAIGQATRK